MKNTTDVRTLRSRIIARLMANPQQAVQFCSPESTDTAGCLAGLILQECGIRMAFDADGQEGRFPISVEPAHAGWLEYEMKRARRGEYRAQGAVLRSAAKAREVWADAYGIDEARFLPLYAHDWECRAADVTREMVVQRLQGLAVLSTAKAG